MRKEVIDRLLQLETTPEALERSRTYLQKHLEQALRSCEDVLICFPDNGENSIGGMMGRVVRSLGAKPIFWGPDYRWKTLLRLAFESHALAVIGPPLVVFGLMKMSLATDTPLNIHKAVVGGYPFTGWITEGIKRGLDCHIWGCYLIGDHPVVAGITCNQEAGIHIRGELFEAQICDETGAVMADAQRGHLTLHYRCAPELVLDSEETAKIWHQPCSCGCDDPRIVDTVYVGSEDADKILLEERYLDWSSVLDCRVCHREDGDTLELVVFPGRVLPKIRDGLSVSIRYWDPDVDEPFCMEKYKKSAEHG